MTLNSLIFTPKVLKGAQKLAKVHEFLESQPMSTLPNRWEPFTRK